MKKGRLTELINEIRVKNKISPDIIILPDTICRKSARGVMYSDGCGGHQSPLHPIETTIVSTIIQTVLVR